MRRLDPDPDLVTNDIGDQDLDAASAQLLSQPLRRVVSLKKQDDVFTSPAEEYQETHASRPCQS